MDSVVATIITTVTGGLGIFLLGMKFMSDGLQVIAGDRLRQLIGLVTNNRFLAVGMGTFVTTIIQSSSVTSVLVVGFVNSKLMTLRQAVGVILGANVGTTITAWILVIAIGKYGLPILGIAAFIYLFVKKEKIQFSGMAIMGIGMVFFGLELMKDGFSPLRTMKAFEQWFHMFQADSYWGVLKCAAIGSLLTCIVQSSSATVGITMGLATTGIIQFETAAALVLGQNVGTTITAFLASIGTTVNARRTAYAHIIFNVLGVVWITALFGVYISIVKNIIGFNPNTMVLVDGAETFPYINAGIAAVHTGFNIINTLAFIPFINVFTRFLEKIVPDTPYVEQPHLTHLDVRMVDTPMLGIEQARKEVVNMSDRNRTMLTDLLTILQSPQPDKNLITSLFNNEEHLDGMQKEITVFITELISDHVVPPSLSEEAQIQVHVTDEYESISDYITANLKLYLKLINADTIVPDEMKNSLFSLHELITNYFTFITTAFMQKQQNIMEQAAPRSQEITHRFRGIRSDLMKQIANNKLSPLLSTAYLDMINNYRHIKNHLLHIAEALSDNQNR